MENIDKKHNTHNWQNGKYVLECLMEGNKRFVASKPLYPNQSQEYRSILNYGQKPIATILGCSDSRVPPEIIFDHGIGDLFIIRVAGHVLDKSIHASIEYAVQHLETSLVMILAHSFCGAVQAAISNAVDETSHVYDLVSKIRPVLSKAKKMPGDFVQNAIKLNAEKIRDEIKLEQYAQKNIQLHKLEVVATYYDLETGKVEILN